MEYHLNFNPATPYYPNPFPGPLQTLSAFFIPICSLWRNKAFLDLDFFEYGQKPAYWDDPESVMAAAEYEIMAPALRLATILLDRVRPQLMKIMFVAVLQPQDTFPEHWTFPPDAHTKFNQELERIAGYYRILHRSATDLGAYAFTGTSAHRNLVNIPAVGAIAEEYHQNFADPDWEYRDPQARHATWLSRGNILLRELTHVIWNDRNVVAIKRHLASKSGSKLPEPTFTSTTTFRELGQVVEEYLFGGRLQLPSNPGVLIDGRAGIALTLYPHSAHLQAAGGRIFWWFSPDTLAALFDQRLWALGQVEVLHVDLLSIGRMPTPVNSAAIGW